MATTKKKTKTSAKTTEPRKKKPKLTGRIRGHNAAAKASKTITVRGYTQHRRKKNKTRKKLKKLLKPKTEPNSIFIQRKANFGIGQDIPRKRDLSKYVRWPRHIRVQRQRSILYQRAQVPPGVNQFGMILDYQTNKQLFKLLHKYRPESKRVRYRRLRQRAVKKLKTHVDEPTRRHYKLVHGTNQVVKLIEKMKARLVVIANNVVPLEIVLILPALCRKLNVPYCIVRSRARLGRLVHMKNCAVVALTKIKSVDEGMLSSIIGAVKARFNHRFELIRKKWGGGRLSTKSQERMRKIREEKERELAIRALHA